MNRLQGVVVVAVLAVANLAHAQYGYSGSRLGGDLKGGRPGAVAIGPFMSASPTDPWATTMFPEQRWRLVGAAVDQYSAGMDYQLTRDGRPSGFLRSDRPTAQGPVSVMQKRSADPLRGKRIRVSGWVRAEGLTGNAGLWMSVEGAEKPTLAFDNLRFHKPSDPSGWVWSEVVLDVPADATEIRYGMMMSASGAAWVNALTVEEVDSNVATTELGI